MSVKPYTMKELKGILDYIIEHKYYNKIKGRKMWMNYANTSLTTRTWQSLKETFLKRILVDLNNPYYKLTLEQIISLKQGCDVEAKEKNKLEIQTISDDSSNDGQKQNNKQPTTSNVKSQEPTVEKPLQKSAKISRHNRSSSETVVLENCYEDAEEIRRVLESSNSPLLLEKVKKKKKFKDFITYSEPLAPILQEVINDFASESESSDRDPPETPMEGDFYTLDTHSEENTKETPKTLVNQENKDALPCIAKTPEDITTNVEEVMLNENQECEDQSIDKITVNKSQTDDLQKIIPVNCVDKTSEEHINGKENADDNCVSNMIANTNPEPELKDVVMSEEMMSVMVNKKTESQTCSNTTDSLLPNNPEAFEMTKIIQKENNIHTDITQENSNNVTIRSIRKRAISEDNLLLDNKKKRFISKIEKMGKLAMKSTTIIENPVENTVENLDEVNADEPKSNINEATTSKLDIETKNDTGPESGLKEKSDIESPQTKNLCPKSVSLSEEQIKEKKGTDSERSGVYFKPKKVESETKDVNIPDSEHIENMICLKSNSEPEIIEVTDNKGSNTTKSTRDLALANVFGFSTGAVASNQKTKLKNRKRSISHHKSINFVDSDSSEWTSQTDSDAYESPPREYRGRQTKKFIKPKSSRILSMEEEGGLFVIYGKRIYPIMNDGNIVKNYVTYIPNNDSDIEDETYWKLKYEEEKRKTKELKKLLNQNRGQSESRDTVRDRVSSSPRTESNSCGKQTTRNLQLLASTPIVETSKVNKERNLTLIDTNKEDKVKIKFTRNNEEVHLEGNWPQIHNVLETVVNIFHKDSGPKIEELKAGTALDSPIPNDISSGNSTPSIIAIDPEVHMKVDTIEKKIFQEIAERDKDDQTEVDEEESNETKRSVQRSRNTSSMPAQDKTRRSISSKPRELENPDESKVETRRSRVQKQTENRSNTSENATYVIRPRTRSKTKKASIELAENIPIQTRKSATLKREDMKNVGDDEKIRYMLPRARRGRPKFFLNGSNNVQKTGSYLTKTAEITSPDSLSRISESTQGYHDSDVSQIQLKKKKKLSTIVRRSKRHSSHVSLRPNLNLILNNPYDTSNSSLSQSKINNTKQRSSAIYNSESYQYLFPHRERSSKILERLDEMCAIENEVKLRRFQSVSGEKYTLNAKSYVNDVGSSSSVSLPLSPELSLVENMSITKDMVNNIKEHHTMDEIQGTNDMNNHSANIAKYLISNMDISLPLMQQICSIDTDVAKDVNRSSDINNKPAVTESLLKEIRSVKIYDNSSDSIDRKLQDLFLESAKKDRVAKNMEVDNIIGTKTKKSGANKKRCSTPRKKKELKKPSSSKVDGIIEEHRESCSSVGGSSCPPLIQVFDENAMDVEEIIPNNNVKRKQKKDIIKVKILKPKPIKSKDNRESETLAENNNRMSICTDSGINDTHMLMFPEEFDNSVELIHNHSETCLHANECIGDSVQLIENNCTAISIDSNSVRSDSGHEFNLNEFQQDESNTQIIDKNNIQNFQLFNDQLKSNGNVENGSAKLRQSLNHGEINSSLITDDLSDDIPTQTRLTNHPTKWFLFSEDEISNTNIARPQGTAVGAGANLRQIFPITCAIPDLSDITEASKENDDGRKPNMDIDLQSVFGIEWN